MKRSPQRFALPVMACAALVVASLLVWPLATRSSEAQPVAPPMAEPQCGSGGVPLVHETTAVVSLNPDSGAAGSSFQAQLSGAPSNYLPGAVEVLWDWDAQTLEGEVIGSGTFPQGQTSVSIGAAAPEDATPGTQWVTVCWEYNDEDDVVIPDAWLYKEAAFSVTEVETPTPAESPTPTPTSTPEPTPDEPAQTPVPTPTVAPPPAPQMYNCPQPGSWAISLWIGPEDTAVGEALDTCGEGAVDAAYALDPDTQSWQRYMAARPDLSNLPTLKDLQVLMLYGGAQAAPPAIYPQGDPGPWPRSEELAGQMVNCPRAGKWALAAWVGPDNTPVEEALATCAGVEVDLLYSQRDPNKPTQGGGWSWSRWVRDLEALSDLTTLDNFATLLVAGKYLKPAYIVVTLEEIQIIDDTDPAMAGEVKIASVVTSGEGKTQKTQYPMTGWVKVSDGGVITMRQPIFALKEDQMGDTLALNVTAVDDDSIPGWLTWSIANFTGPALAAFAGGVGLGSSAPVIKTLGDKLGKDLAAWMGKNEEIGIFTNSFRRDEDWGVREEFESKTCCTEEFDCFQCGSERLYEALVGKMVVRYSIHRREALDQAVTVSLRPAHVYYDCDDWAGEMYVWARVADGMAGELLDENITRLPPSGTRSIDSGSDWSDATLVRPIFYSTESAGPFIYFEAAMWEEDDLSDDDQIGIVSELYDTGDLQADITTCRQSDPPDDWCSEAGGGRVDICWSVDVQ